MLPFRKVALQHEVVKLTNNLVSPNECITPIRKLNNAGENFLTEAGLYGLILVSRKPQAKTFKRWIKHEVLPSIRKHGMYATPTTIDEMIENPDMIIKLATKLKEERLAKEKAIKEKAWISNKREATCMITTAKAVQKANAVGEKIGESYNYAAIKPVISIILKNKKIYKPQIELIESIVEITISNPTIYKKLWMPLKHHSGLYNLKTKKVHDETYGSVNSYHKTAWKAVYDIDLKKIFKI